MLTSTLKLDQLDQLGTDLVIKTQDFLDLFGKMGAKFKVKNCKKIKPIKQIILRTSFFQGANGREEPFVIDGKNLNFEIKEGPTVSRNIRNAVLDIIKMSLEVEEVMPDKLAEYRKSLGGLFKRFVENYKSHIKKNRSHDEVIAMMKPLVAPYEAVMDCNMRLTMVDFQFQDDDGFDIHNFQYKALITNFCSSYQALQDLLLIHNVHRFNPSDPKNAAKVFNKDLIYSNSPDIYRILQKF